MKNLFLLLALPFVFGTAAMAQQSSDDATILQISTSNLKEATHISDLVPALKDNDVLAYEISVKIPGTKQLHSFEVEGKQLSDGAKAHLVTVPVGAEIWVDNVIAVVDGKKQASFYKIQVTQ